MTPYWLVFLLLATLAFVESRRIAASNGYLHSSFNPLWWFFNISNDFYWAQTSSRGDWGSYQIYF